MKNLISVSLIRLYGIGASYLVCKDLQQKLERINKHCILYEDIHMQLISASNIKEDELAFVISYSGITQEIVNMANMIKNNGAKLISITRYDSNQVMSLADYKMFVQSTEGIKRISAESSRISQMALIDVIYNTYIEKMKIKYYDRIIQTGYLLKKEDKEDENI